MTTSTTTESSSLINRMFAVGAHFGFKKSRRHPTVTTYLYGTKDGNDIFDLEKTAPLLEAACEIMRTAGQNGKTVLYVGTKTEISPLVRNNAEAVSMPYVTNRWIGGMLTNFSEMKRRINRFEVLNHERESGELDRKYTKKERVMLTRETTKLEFNFGGIKAMTKTPNLLVVVDPRHDSIAVAEAREMKIPVIALMSSDCDIKAITYPVILNDALQASVTFALDELTKAFKSGATAFTPIPSPVRDTVARRPRVTV